MPAVVDTLGTTTSTPGTTTMSGGSQAMPGHYCQPYIEVHLTHQYIAPGESQQTYILQNTVLSVQIQQGLDIGISTATIELAEDPGITLGTGGISKYSVVQILAGCDPTNVTYQKAVRFSGIYLSTEINLWPHSYTLVCRGFLYLAEQYQNYYVGSITDSVTSPGWIAGMEGIALPPPTALNKLLQSQPHGLPLITIPSNVLGPDSEVYVGLADPGTDENIVKGILGLIFSQLPPNVTLPSGVWAPDMIWGTGLKCVATYLDAVWPLYGSAWEEIQKFDQAFLGYRTFETRAGRIRRQQIMGFPVGPPQFTFQEGHDIWEARGSRSVEHLINAVIAEGMVDSATGNFNGAIFGVQVQSNPFQSPERPITEIFRNTFIETSDFWQSNNEGEPTREDRLNANRVCEWRLAEGNRESVKVQFTTFLDYPIEPGMVIMIKFPHAAIDPEPVWVQHVETRVSYQPALFQLTISGIGGGLSYSTPLSGTVTKVAGTQTLTGTGTAFTTELTRRLVFPLAIQVPSDAGYPAETMLVQSVESDTSLTVWAGPAHLPELNVWQANGTDVTASWSVGYAPLSFS